jgi:hypothetical protein
MMIIALDLARRTGIAKGEIGQIPMSFVAELKKSEEDVLIATTELARLLDSMLQTSPGMIVAEEPLPPPAHKDHKSIILQYRLHGVVDAVAAIHNVRVYRVSADKVRQHFCGRTSALPRARGPQTRAQQDRTREATKQMVIRQAITLGYLPAGTEDSDQADACAIFDWFSAEMKRQAVLRRAK